MDCTGTPDQTSHTKHDSEHRNERERARSKEPAKGPKANKEQGKATSRKLTSHFIPAPLRPLWWGRRDPHLAPTGQTAGQHEGERAEVKIKGWPGD
uniref:Uncharacterized protein n=1 Tax=Knipowitschia caucasica TaxID=637954 RepID=A0AAV2L7C8_KNICA